MKIQLTVDDSFGSDINKYTLELVERNVGLTAKETCEINIGRTHFPNGMNKSIEALRTAIVDAYNR